MIEPIDAGGDFLPRPLEVIHDDALDIITIEGVRFSGWFFRVLATTGPSDQAFKIISRDEDGVLTIKKVEAPL